MRQAGFYLDRPALLAMVEVGGFDDSVMGLDRLVETWVCVLL